MVAIVMSSCLVLAFLLILAGNVNGIASRIVTWIPTAIIYSEIYMLPCYLLEKYAGRGRHGPTFKVSRLAITGTWVWAIALTAGGISSLCGLGFIPVSIFF